VRFDSAAVEGPYLRDILAQPQALAETVAGLSAAPALPRFSGVDRVILTGMGASFHALHPLAIRLAAHGYCAAAYETSELIHYYAGALSPRTLVIAVSQSGRSVEIVRLLDTAPQGMRIIGVTNTPDSPLATRADHTVMTRAGAEYSVSTKTFVTILLALEWLGAALCGGDRRAAENTLCEAAPAAAQYLAGWETKVASLAALFDGVRALFVTGRGSSLAAAGTGGLILKESAHFHAEGMTCSAFRHGPFEMSGPGAYLLAFAGDAETAPLNENLVRDVRAAGGKAALIGPQSDVDAFRIPETAPAVRPVLEMLPLQLTSLAIAALAGHAPGQFQLLTKVTTIE